MNGPRTTTRKLFYLLFAVSGFSGLIYESIWTHYIKLFLGHSAYAQTIVLAIFMGGMAIGAWICSRFSGRWNNLLLGYAIAEGVIGVCALLFHTAFTKTIAFSYLSIIPQLGSPAVVTLFKWGLSALMILPQTILLGMSFPLMSSGLLRIFPDRPGRIVAMLYFTNSLGGVVGVLASGFILVRLTGLPGTVAVAGGINLLLSVTVCFLVRFRIPVPVSCQIDQVSTKSSSDSGNYSLYLMVAFVTGAASLIYEIGWIRLLSLVMGGSTHSFELMLSVFILGLALGGLWVHRRIDSLDSPARFLCMVQVVMGGAALASLMLYGSLFGAMRWLVTTLPRSGAGYLLFNLCSWAMAMLIMLPATFCAGMTLPLITCMLIRKGMGEQSVGAVYAANTVGSIAGAFLAIHLGMPLLGLKGLITAGGGLDIAAGLLLMWFIGRGGADFRRRLIVTVSAVFTLLAAILLVKLDPYSMGSGVYRQGTILSPENSSLLYYRDGKTASVSCFLENGELMSVRTNGKPDASVIQREDLPVVNDEYTMRLLGIMPMLYHPQARNAAVIGLGCGMTTLTLLENPRIEHVDTVEIEPAMIEASKQFRDIAQKIRGDKRSRIINDDARTFFSSSGNRYDLIVSEPSNPWVSGVSSLFTEEFYRVIKNRMNEGGVFVQWVHLYEINNDLVASILKAMAGVFTDFALYSSTNGDMLVVASAEGMLRKPDYAIMKNLPIASAMKRININGQSDIEIRRIAAKQTVEKLLHSYPVPANSDYHPFLDQRAARSMFMKDAAQEWEDLTNVPLPILEMLEGASAVKSDQVTISPHYEKALRVSEAVALGEYFRNGVLPEVEINDELKEAAVKAMEIHSGKANSSEVERIAIAFRLSVAMIPYLSRSELHPLIDTLNSGGFDSVATQRERQWYGLYREIAARDARGMLNLGRSMLESEQRLIPQTRRYLLAAAMLGAIVQGERGEAARLWRQYSPILFADEEPSLLFRLLAAESCQG